MARTFAPVLHALRTITTSNRLGNLSIPRPLLRLEELERREVMAPTSTLNLTIFNNTGFADDQVHIAIYGTLDNGNFGFVDGSKTVNGNNPYVDAGLNGSLQNASFLYATTLLANVANSTVTTIQVASTQGNAPTPAAVGTSIRIDNEIMLVTGFANATAFTVLRGYQNTTPTSHVLPANISQTLPVYITQYVPNYLLTDLPNYSNVTHSATFFLDGTVNFESDRMLIGVGSDVAAMFVHTSSGTTITSPTAQSPTDPNTNTFWDFVEPSLKLVTVANTTETQFVLDTSQVDAFGFPITIQVTPHDAAPNKQQGSGIPGNVTFTREDIFKAFGNAVAGTPFATSLTLSATDGGNITRILSPASVLAQNPIYYTTGNVANGSPFIRSNFTGEVGNLTALFGNNIPLGAQIVGTSIQAIQNNASTIFNSNTVTLANTAGLLEGMALTVAQNSTVANLFPAGTTILNIVANTSLTLSNVATATSNGTLSSNNAVTLTFQDYGFLLNVAATGNATDAPLTIINNPNFDGGNTSNANGLLALGHYFDDAIGYLFGTDIGNITLTVPNPGANKADAVSRNDGDSYTFVGRLANHTQPDIYNTSTTYTVLEFTYTGTLGGAANQTQTFYVYEPFFSTNTPDAALPAPPSYFNSGSGNISITMTPGQMVFGSGGVFADNVNQTGYSANDYKILDGLKSNLLANIENQLASSLNRGMAAKGNTTIAWTDQSQFYTGSGTGNDAYNVYAKFLHSMITVGSVTANVAIDGRAYGFAFDDQSGCDTTLTSQPASSATVTLGAWGLGNTPSPPPPGPPPPPPPGPPPPPSIASYYAVGTDEGVPAAVQVYNANGTLLTSLAPFAGFSGGVRVAVGDVNGDQVPDIIASAGPKGGPRVVVFSGTDFTTMLASFYAYGESFHGGVYVAAGDIDGDGDDEVVTGAGATGSPHVRVFDINGGQATQLPGPVGSFYALDPRFTGGITVAAGNIDGVGPDEIIAAPASNGGSQVVVFSASGVQLHSFYAYASNFSGGVYLATGDINGDGRDDILTGPGRGLGPLVNIYDMTESVTTPYKSITAYDPSFMGGVRVGSFDINGDLRADILTGPGPTGGPQANVYDGISLALLSSTFVYDETMITGIFVT